MPASRLHLVRHGEVNNPEGILYGRLPNFGLTQLGHEMALAAAEEIRTEGRRVSGLYCSPLQRTRESARPFAKMFGLDPIADERLLEPTNRFQGRRMDLRTIASTPSMWWHLRNPRTPSWGEHYASVVTRMFSVMDEARDSVQSGDVVLVTHQMPIWMVHLAVSGTALAHNPRLRRCSLSSITSFEHDGEVWREVDYREPARNLKSNATDVGAV